MYADMGARPLAIRPAHEAYRSMPGTPMGMDPRGLNSMELATAMDHARSGLEGGDYFLGAARYPPGTMRPRSPMVPVSGQPWDHDHGFAASGSMNNVLGFRERDRERDLEDSVRRDNRVAALLNGAILAPSKYALVHPLRCDDGSYPADFRSAKTVSAMRVLDNSQLDRIMQAYRLPLDLSSNAHHTRDSTSSSRVRQAKLFSLWEYLGAYHLLEYETFTKGLRY
ncbi:MAG: hypothetical protein Q9184_008315 [Pyrenodesmia sp. 2 TL-2023]